jgi:hypothetical protein
MFVTGRYQINLCSKLCRSGDLQNLSTADYLWPTCKSDVFDSIEDVVFRKLCNLQ